MPALFMKQPNGRYARWSSVVDDFTHFNMTRDEAIEEARTEMGVLEAQQKIERADKDERANGAPGNGLDRWHDALDTMRNLGKKKEADAAEKTDREEPKWVGPPEPPLVLDKVVVAYSEPQTMLCTTDGIGLATIHGKDRAERERVAKWLVEKINGKPRCRFRWRAGVLTPPGEPVIPDKARCLLEPHDESVPHKFRED